MSTPIFNPTHLEYEDVRLYTEFDPYFYTVDNRPLQDIVGNYSKIGSAADAARRATLIDGLGQSATLSGLVGLATRISGLRASNPSTGIISLSPGVMYTPLPVSDSDPKEVLKRAPSPSQVNLSCPMPITPGKEIRYLIQARYKEITSTSDNSLFDAINPFLRSTLFNGVLELGVVASLPVDAGTSTELSPDAGWSPLYSVLNTYGQVESAISTAPGCPDRISELPLDNVWTPATLLGSWGVFGGGYQGPEYRKVGDYVQIRGSIKAGTSSTTAFTLPVGLRPVANNVFSCTSGASQVAVEVTSAGAVIPRAAGDVHLGMIEFHIG